MRGKKTTNFNEKDGNVSVTSIRGRDESVFQCYLNHEAVQNGSKRAAVCLYPNRKCEFTEEKGKTEAHKMVSSMHDLNAIQFGR